MIGLTDISLNCLEEHIVTFLNMRIYFSKSAYSETRWLFQMRCVPADMLFIRFASAHEGSVPEYTNLINHRRTQPISSGKYKFFFVFNKTYGPN